MSQSGNLANDENLVAEFERDRPDLYQLAQLTCLARTVEPLLLRNMRLRFMPASETELEAELWYSPLISALSTRNFVLRQGAARQLAEDLREADIWLNSVEALNQAPQDHYANWQEKIWQLTQRYTQHWKGLDILEQELRYYAFQGKDEKVRQGIRYVLQELSKTSEQSQRLKLARWAKKTLPHFLESLPSMEETTWLAQYSAQSLDATAKWTELTKPQPLPDWLADVLPAPLRASSTYKLDRQVGIRIFHDPEKHNQILEFTEAKQGSSLLPLATQLPARIHISYADRSDSYTIYIGKKIKLSGSPNRITLTTIDGKHFDLYPDVQAISDDEPGQAIPDLYLSFVREDSSLATEIAEWLARQKLDVRLVEESPSKPGVPAQNEHSILMRLWTPAAQQTWQKAPTEIEQTFSNNLLLRTQVTATPLGINPAQIVELTHWQTSEDSERSLQAQQLLATLKDWMSGRQPSPPSDPGPAYSNEVKRLLNELKKPETTPKRRLEIGDRLNDLDDPRPGVGVREYEIIEYSPEVQTLLNELQDITTLPPRRLEIGNLLDELGDPRNGVGLDDTDKPEIDWVEVPAGEFIYAEADSQQTLLLDRFFISRYTITNKQFQAFVDDGAYKDKRWWQDIERRDYKESEWPQNNRPKTDVSWYEAVAYTRWLSESLGYEICLATEQQWEKAARGTDGRVYPWGNAYRSGYANVDETEKEAGNDKFYLRETTAVGVYPHGKSPFGLKDLSGNVWEWCLNKHGNPEVIVADTSGESRVMRGGSWFRSPDFARSDWRNGYNPGYHNLDVGFRVVCVLPSTEH